MNQLTSKLIRKYATASGLPYRVLKKAWNKVPRNKRRVARLQLQSHA